MEGITLGATLVAFMNFELDGVGMGVFPGFRGLVEGYTVRAHGCCQG